MMKIGVFGGTFNPPHKGHFELAEAALEQLQLDFVLWVLTPDPPHKTDQPISPWQLRKQMVEEMISGNEKFRISMIEHERPGPHYAVDTVKALKVKHPEDQFIYLMGGDSLHDLPDWHDPQGFVDACDGIGVLRRPDDDVDMSALAETLPGLEQKVAFVDSPLIAISSHQIRQMVFEGKDVIEFVGELVQKIINRNHLYLNN
jgi:nicotinate-nucleotide adenylyltransferase